MSMLHPLHTRVVYYNCPCDLPPLSVSACHSISNESQNKGYSNWHQESNPAEKRLLSSCHVTMVTLAFQQDERGNFPVLIHHRLTCPLTLEMLTSRGGWSESLTVASKYFSGLFLHVGREIDSDGGSGVEQYCQKQIEMGAINPYIRITVGYVLTLKTTQFVTNK